MSSDEAPANETPRKRLSAEQRRESILDAANEVFGERGYEHVRIDDIAAAAGISKALIYEHFRSKHQLYIELMNRATGKLVRGIVANATGPGVEGSGRLEGAADALFDFVSEEPHSFHMFVRDVTDPEIASHQEALRRGAVAAMADLMEMEPPERQEGLERRHLEELAEMIVGGAYALAEWSLHHPEADRRELSWILLTFMWLGLGRMQVGDRWQFGVDGGG